MLFGCRHFRVVWPSFDGATVLSSSLFLLSGKASLGDHVDVVRPGVATWPEIVTRGCEAAPRIAAKAPRQWLPEGEVVASGIVAALLFARLKDMVGRGAAHKAVIRGWLVPAGHTILGRRWHGTRLAAGAFFPGARAFLAGAIFARAVSAVTKVITRARIAAGRAAVP